MSLYEEEEVVVGGWREEREMKIERENIWLNMMEYFANLIDFNLNNQIS